MLNLKWDGLQKTIEDHIGLLLAKCQNLRLLHRLCTDSLKIYILVLSRDWLFGLLCECAAVQVFLIKWTVTVNYNESNLMNRIYCLVCYTVFFPYLILQKNGQIIKLAHLEQTSCLSCLYDAKANLLTKPVITNHWVILSFHWETLLPLRFLMSLLDNIVTQVL